MNVPLDNRVAKLAEVVGSNPATQSIFITLVNYGILLNLILTIVGQTLANPWTGWT